MKVRNIIRKAAVLGASATMLGATVMGALAYDLADYPAQFVVDGVFDGKIVVGEKAATSDVLGAIDIAASLQARSVTTEEVEIPGMAGEVSLSGDAFRLETGSDLLEIRETVGEVYDTLTSSELEALRGGSITTDEGNTDYNQYLRFGDNAASALEEMAVNYLEDEDNVLGDFLVIDDSEPFFEWEIEFSEGLESAMTTQLADLEDEVFNIFGTDFTFVDSTITSGSANKPLTLSFMAGDVSDTLREGETKTYTIDGVDYEVTAVFISDPSTGSTGSEAKFAVNGELTDGLTDGQTDTLSGGLQIGVRDLLVNSREGVVEFFLGANKIEFKDSVTTSDTFASGVEIGNENIEDASISIIGGLVGTDTYEITSIKYRLKADASVGSTIYVPAGHGVREFLDEPEGLLSPTFDIRYEGLKDVERTDLKYDARSDHSYDLTVTNIRGKEYDFPLITNKATYKWGDDDDCFIFTEATANTSNFNLSDADDFNIWDDWYFVVSEGDNTAATEKHDSAVLRYEDIDTSDRILTFTDMSTGESKTVSYTADTSADADLLGTASNFVVEGQTYTVYIANDTAGVDAYRLAIDLDGDGSLNAARAVFVTKGGLELTFDDAAQTDFAATCAADAVVVSSYAIDQAQFDDTTGETFEWEIQSQTGNQITMAMNQANYTGPSASTNKWDDFDIISDDANDDYDRAMTDYGVEIEFYNPTGTNDAKEATFSVPETQVGAQVFVVAGVTERSTGGAGSVMRDMVNPIAVGMAVLDVDAPALGEENLIIVGGPAINVRAMEFLGNPEDPAEGFEPGKAMISAMDYDDTVAILVAGYEAQETLGASYVLADYAVYLADVEGGEVEVVASDLSDLQVMAVDAMMDE